MSDSEARIPASSRSTAVDSVRAASSPVGVLRAIAVIAMRWGMLSAGAIVFVALAGGLFAGGLSWIDVPIAGFAATLRTPALTEVMKLVTKLGNGEVIAGVTVIATVSLWLTRYQRPALFVALSAAGAGALNTLLKYLFARARPEELARLASADGFAFPSGHAMAGAAIYAAIGLVFVLRFPRLRFAVPIACGLLVFAVGFSRVYLGVHYPSDVLAGWALGISWPFWLRPLLIAKASVKPAESTPEPSDA